MDKFTAADAINGKSFGLWVNGLKKAEVLTAQADSEIQTEKLPIAGKLSDEDMEDIFVVVRGGCCIDHCMCDDF